MITSRRCRLAVVASHPIQYFTPLYQRLARRPDIDLDVFFCRDFGARPRFDRQFGRTVAWDTDLLGGYRHRFLWNASPITDPFNPLHAVNPGAFTRVLGGFDAVWVNGYLYPSNWLAATAAAMRGARLLFRSELRQFDRPRRWHTPMRDRIVTSWIRHADALLYIGKANRDAYVRFGAEERKLHFSPYAADVDALQRARRDVAARRTEVLRAWGLPTDRVIVLFVGKLFDRKQPGAMLHLAAQPALTETSHIVLAGSGPLEGALEDERRRRGLQNVSFLGFVNQSKLPELYALADIYVMPSLWETWGLVLNEAMAAGAAPVAANDVGASFDLITDGETGFTVDPRDWDALANRVIRLATDAPLRARIARAAQERSASYSYDAAVDGVVHALASLGLIGSSRVLSEPVPEAAADVGAR